MASQLSVATSIPNTNLSTTPTTTSPTTHLRTNNSPPSHPHSPPPTGRQSAGRSSLLALPPSPPPKVIPARSTGAGEGDRIWKLDTVNPAQAHTPGRGCHTCTTSASPTLKVIPSWSSASRRPGRPLKAVLWRVVRPVEWFAPPCKCRLDITNSATSVLTRLLILRKEEPSPALPLPPPPKVVPSWSIAGQRRGGSLEASICSGLKGGRMEPVDQLHPTGPSLIVA